MTPYAGVAANEARLTRITWSSNLSWSALLGQSVLPTMRHHSAGSLQPIMSDSRAATSATRTQSAGQKVFFRSGLYLGALSRPKNPLSSDASARAGKTSIKWRPLTAARACSGLSSAPSAVRKRQIGEASQNMPCLPRLEGCTPPPSQPMREAATRSTGRMLVKLGTTVGWSGCDSKRCRVGWVWSDLAGGFGWRSGS